MKMKLPKKCFISHSYKDAVVRERLIDSLPDSVQKVVYPPITVAPDQLVSNPLIVSLLDCDGLIYLNGGYSEQSFWVAFERDYALRAGKKVFSADPNTLEITPHVGDALDLAAYASYHRADAPRVRHIADFLNHERHFDLLLDMEKWQARMNIQAGLVQSLEDSLNRGGYVIIFWSKRASKSVWINAEYELAIKQIPNITDRVFFALLEDVPLPEFWLRFHEFHKIQDWQKTSTVQLYGDANRSMEQRLDDLVVVLYWLIYRKTKHSHLDLSDA